MYMLNAMTWLYYTYRRNLNPAAHITIYKYLNQLTRACSDTLDGEPVFGLVVSKPEPSEDMGM